MTTQNPYLLLTPGPLSTTPAVREAMLRDWCTWDADYNNLVEGMRRDLVALAIPDEAKRAEYTAVPMQGSGTYGVESVIGSVVPEDGRILVLANGAYGRRAAQIARTLHINTAELSYRETERPDAAEAAEFLDENPDVTHVLMIHCETTTGILNDIESVAREVKRRGKIFIVDAMSSFGGVPIDMAGLGIDFMISSANKCIQGVPGFSFVIARRAELEKCEGRARSVSLDLYDQWKVMEQGHGKWRFTSPTHVVRAFIEALKELCEEGGVAARHKRYAENQRRLAEGMNALGFKPLLREELQSPIITSFLYPDKSFDFKDFYEFMKAEGYVLYPGKISEADTFRVGNIGDVHPKDIEGVLAAAAKYVNR